MRWTALVPVLGVVTVVVLSVVSPLITSVVVQAAPSGGDVFVYQQVILPDPRLITGLTDPVPYLGTGGGCESCTSGSIALPFPFPFFGRSMQYINVCANGWVQLTDFVQTNTRDSSPCLAGLDAANPTLPSDQFPSGVGIIAFFMTDLNPAEVLSPTVYPSVLYRSSSTSFVLQFSNIAYAYQSGFDTREVMSIQVTLAPDGSISVYYPPTGFRSTAGWARYGTQRVVVGIQSPNQRQGSNLKYFNGGVPHSVTTGFGFGWRLRSASADALGMSNRWISDMQLSTDAASSAVSPANWRSLARFGSSGGMF